MDFEKLLEQVQELAVNWGLRLVGVFVALFVAWIVAGWTRRAVLRAVHKRNIDQAVGKFFASLARYGILAAAAIGCLGVFGIQTASFAAVLAAMGLAVGLAFQGTLSNFASGVMLLIFRPFKVDDVVKVAGELGVVKEIDLFTTEMVTFDNRRIILPNSKIFGDKIENLTHYPTRRVEISVGTDYAADLEETRRALESAARSTSKVLEEPAFQVFLAELGDNAVSWKVRLWCKTEDFGDVHQEGILRVKSELAKANISIPFPQLDVHMASAANA